MPTVSLGAPDQQGYWASSSFTSEDSMVAMGTFLVGGARWASVAVPRDSDITSATLSLAGTSGGSIRLVLADNIPSLTTAGWHTTTASAAVPASASVDLTAAVQALVERPGWDTGHALAVRLEGSGWFTEYQADATGLSITWADPYQAGTDQTVDPWSTVTLTGTPSGGSWSQTSGPSVTLSGSGAVRTFTAPASMSQQVLGFQYGEDSMTVTIRSARVGIVTGGGGLTPARFRIVQ